MIDFIKHLILSTKRDFIDWEKKDKSYMFSYDDMKTTISKDIKNDTYTISTVITVSTEKQITSINLEYKSIRDLYDLLNE